MDEKNYWERLEFRICQEFQGFDDKHLRWHWCDGLVTEEYDLLGEQPRIRGQAPSAATAHLRGSPAPSAHGPRPSAN
ncbi:hypothetical protein AB0I61_06010 [Polymorphospora rubra]|uniref:hypothetical protein n=1 Tax=Polymorphospora rubra TaxID=338584 RepID=UPI0033FBA169